MPELDALTRRFVMDDDYEVDEFEADVWRALHAPARPWPDPLLDVQLEFAAEVARQERRGALINVFLAVATVIVAVGTVALALATHGAA